MLGGLLSNSDPCGCFACWKIELLATRLNKAPHMTVRLHVQERLSETMWLIAFLGIGGRRDGEAMACGCASGCRRIPVEIDTKAVVNLLAAHSSDDLT